MHHATTRRAARTTHRTSRPALSPYLLDEVGLTLAEIRQARAAGELAARR